MATVTTMTAEKIFELFGDIDTNELLQDAKAYIDAKISVPNIEVTNLNDLTASFSGTGTWRTNKTITNSPADAPNGAAYLSSKRFTSTAGIQWYFATPWGHSIQIWQRAQFDGVWGAWARMDADFLKTYADNNQNIPTLNDTDLNTFTAPFGGTGRWRASASSGVTNFPPELQGGGALFWQHRFTSVSGIQTWTNIDGEWSRRQIDGVWSPWVRVDVSDFDKGIIEDGVALDTILEAGNYRVTQGQTHANSPFPSPGTSYTLEVLGMGTSWRMQRATDQYGQVKFRSGVGSGGVNWNGWRDFPETSGGGGGGGNLTGGLSRTAMETTGYWTSLADEETYYDNLNVHRGIEILNIGKSFENRDMRAIRIGNPNKPAILFVGEQHGNEPGGREGLMIFAREVLNNPKNMALPDVCLLIVPTANPDRFNQTRNSANGINLNRDWELRTEPETQAITSLLTSHNVVAGLDIHNFGYIRHVSMRESRKGPAPVQSAALDLYNALFAAYEAAGQSVRQYGEPEDPITDGSMANELAGIHGIPGVLLEMPYHRELTNLYTPEPAWHAQMALLGAEAFLDYVWRNLETFANL